MPTQPIDNKPIAIIFFPNDIVLDKYRILSKIGEGGMNSTIYKAEDIKVNHQNVVDPKEKYVAIKVVNKDDRLSDKDWIKMHDECVTAQRVSNKKNIVNTYEVSKINNGNTIIIVMEYVDGISLQEYLNKISSFSVKEAVYFFRQIVEAIKELHSFSEKVIHRDLKLDNIMISKDLMSVKLIDFGISTILIESTITDDKKVISVEDQPWGSPLYICPDLIEVRNKKNDKLISEQFDFFPLGVIFYEMLMGEKPFKALPEDKANKILRLPLTYDIICISDINPSIPVAIENIIFRCLASKPADLKYRYHSAKEILDDLDDYSANKDKAKFAKLLKPKNERTLQVANFFNIQTLKEKEKIYEKHWFYWLIFSIAMVIVIFVIILLTLHVIS